MKPTQNAALAAFLATALASGAVIAADTAAPAPAGQLTAAEKTADQDALKLSSDGSRAYADVVLTRLAIFDGRTGQAKTLINEAATSFDKAKDDASVFTKAEADLKVPATNGREAPAPAAGDKAQAGKAIAWLPVDGEILLDEDFSASPKKATAAAEANKSLAKGDRKGAIEKLKIADINVDYVLAVVPRDQTVTDVHKAADMINAGKFYEASQVLRKVEASARYDMLDINATPKGAPQAKSASPDSANVPAKAAEPSAAH